MDKERSHGHWILLDKDLWRAAGDESVMCSECKFKYYKLMPRHYCSNCGAKMDEAEE